MGFFKGFAKTAEGDYTKSIQNSINKAFGFGSQKPKVAPATPPTPPSPPKNVGTMSIAQRIGYPT